MNNIICIRENLKIAKTWLFDIWSFSKNPDPSRVGILRTHTALLYRLKPLYWRIKWLCGSIYIYIYTSPFLSPCQIICNGVEFLSKCWICGFCFLPDYSHDHFRWSFWLRQLYISWEFYLKPHRSGSLSPKKWVNDKAFFSGRAICGSPDVSYIYIYIHYI